MSNLVSRSSVVTEGQAATSRASALRGQAGQGTRALEAGALVEQEGEGRSGGAAAGVELWPAGRHRPGCCRIPAPGRGGRRATGAACTLQASRRDDGRRRWRLEQSRRARGGGGEERGVAESGDRRERRAARFGGGLERRACLWCLSSTIPTG
ncbi:hypothetical protein DAI22_05g099101 [Oryza sativa Japonica Group]|jgi:hypothetical protein|nr:hypothetical protein DAI22_05g099101 [Oryza sativa Japonica Group]